MNFSGIFESVFSLPSSFGIPTVAKRLGHANANVTLSIYAHALEADELAAAKIWNDAMASLIETHKRQANGNLGLSRLKPA